MLTITFKDVGQGDSIVVEWIIDGIEYVGIVDCNLLSGGKNPVLEHIKIKKYTQISFIVLSHPHTDHFSGFISLLEYCENKKIKVLNFIHTARGKLEYLRASVRKGVPSNELSKLFIYLDKLYKKGVVKEYFALSGKSYHEESIQGLSLGFLSPTTKEYSRFESKIHKTRIDTSKNNPDANIISTIIKISLDKDYVLLTSDATNSSFLLIDRFSKHHLSTKMLLGQIPHHGSNLNHWKKFWNGINRDDMTPSVISVGVNDYGHPAKEVISSFQKMKYKICATNYVGELDPSMIEVDKIKESFLDLISESAPTSTSPINGDQIFVF